MSLQATFESFPFWLNVVIFSVSAGLIWVAGTRLERFADEVSTRTGLGQAFTGMLLLSAATSLPEVATTVTAVAILENPTLAVHNLLGGVAMQTAILALADLVTRKRGALTFFTPRFVLITEGMGLLMLLQLTVAGVTIRGFPSVAWIGVWPVLIFVAYLIVIYLTYRNQGQPRWTPTRRDDVPVEREETTEILPDTYHYPLWRTWSLFAVASLVVLIAGWSATQSVEVLAQQTGLGEAFLGATLLALATSLPEVSTTIAASRGGRFSMAISNIFGSNAFDVALLFLAELLFVGGTILANADWTVVFIAAIAGIMICIYLWGLMEQENRVVLGIGWDSAAAVLVYLGGMSILFFLG